MKKMIFVTIALLSVIYLGAQVKSFSVSTSKTYEDNTRTSYLLLDADLDAETVMLIEKELEQHPDIKRFSFYNKNDFSKCMFTTNMSLDEQIVVDLMNDAIFSSGETGNSYGRNFLNRGFVNNQHIARFSLDFEEDYDLMREINTIFKESDKISDVNYKGKSSYEIYSEEIIYPDYIENLLMEWEIKITKEDIK